MSFYLDVDNRSLSPLICAGIAIIMVILLHKVVRYLCSSPESSILKLCGPPSQSYFLGNISELDTSPVGECEFKWMEKYGHIYRIDAGFGSSTLVISDPRALQHIFQTSGYSIVKSPLILERSKMLFGVNILSTEGSVHKRHRKALLPAFGPEETKALTSIFQGKAMKLVDVWRLQTKTSNQLSLVVNVHAWLARATLDAIGEGAFGYQFGAMDDQENKLGKVYQNIVLKAVGSPSRFQITLMNLAFRFPVMGNVLASAPTKANRAMVETRNAVRKVAGQLFDEKWSATDVDGEDGKRDVMSLLTKSNAAEDVRSRLTRLEVIDQMGAIMFAGHETTSNTLSWAFWELAKDQRIQDKLREEVLKLSKECGEGVIPISEYGAMEYMGAFIKEVLRFHPIIPRLGRRTAKGMVLPLSDPITDTDGKVLHELYLPKGTRVLGNVVAYNRHPRLWGTDPHAFRPERWFNMKEKGVKFGVYGNMAVFGSGIHACIGWRFALHEIQSFLIALLLHFRFEIPEESPMIRRTYAGVMIPQVEGENRAISMPLKVTLLEPSVTDL